MDNLGIDSIGETEASRLEREFKEDEVKEAVFMISGDKAPRPDGLLIFFFQRFWLDLKDEIVLHQRIPC